MLSLEDVTAVRIAIELWNNNELKKELICAPGSEYDVCVSRYDSYSNCESKWKEILQNKTPIILENIGLPRALLEKVGNLVILIGWKMLTWVNYHEGTLGLSREYIIKFLNSYFFTSQGIIDNKKTAKELMKDSCLKTKQKYRLACLYCFTRLIPDLYKQMSKEEKENQGQELNYPETVKFWSDYQMGEVDQLRGEKTLDQYMLEKAIESGSKETVEYCLEETSLSRKKDAVIVATLQTMRKTTEIHYLYNWMPFKKCHRVPLWIAADYFVDILCFLFSKISQEQNIESLKKYIEGSLSPELTHPSFRVLSCFLHWPYQNYFMKTTNLLWEFLSERTYVDLLCSIYNKIYTISPKSILAISEEKSYDYRKLLKDFWSQSPDHYKRYVFSNTESIYINGDAIQKNFLIVELLTSKMDTYEDREIFELILDNATDEERNRIISSEEGKDICIRLMEEEKWKMLDEFISECIASKEELEEFKRKLSFTKEAYFVCVNFIPHKWDAAEFFIKWSSLSKEEIIRFKREMICSVIGKYACWDLFLYKGVEIVNSFLMWCFSSEEEIRKFKKDLFFSVDLESYSDLIIDDKLEVVDEFIQWSHLSEEEIKEFREHLQYEKGNDICENLITGDVRKRISNDIWYMFDHTIQFQGGKWVQVEKFLTWCCSSEEEKRVFKKDRILKISGTEIHFYLIEPNQWEEAETFFAWLELSPEEVKELKKETLFNHDMANRMFHLLMCRRHNEEFSDYESRQEGLEMYLRWHLTDRETVLEYRDHFKRLITNDCRYVSEEDIALLKDFDSAIEQRLSDLVEEQRGTKRKSEMNKDFRDVEIKKIRTAECDK